MLSKYLKPKSLAWLSAICEITVNILRLSGVEVPIGVDGIIAGLFGVGMRGAVK